jgi:hypothetical protein
MQAAEVSCCMSMIAPPAGTPNTWNSGLVQHGARGVCIKEADHDVLHILEEGPRAISSSDLSARGQTGLALRSSL